MESNNEKKTDRRCFLTNCAKFAIGAALMGVSYRSNSKTNDSYLDYGYCIYKCPQPCSYNPSCNGCRENNSLTCATKLCAISKGMPSCAHCTSLENCTVGVFGNYPSQRSYALNKQRQWGLITSIDSNEKKNFNVYPTLADDKITIANNQKLKADYRILNLEGKIVKNGHINSTSHNVDVLVLTPGHYIINILQNNKLLYVDKFIKN